MTQQWRDVVSIHPAADLFPPLGADELRELADDIKANGLHEKVKIIERCRRRPDGTRDVRGQEQVVIDGRNRLDAMELAGQPIFRRGSTELRNDVADILDENEDDVLLLDDRKIKITDYVISVNIRRRHLTGEQKRDLVAKLLKTNPERSNLQTAKIVGVDDKTVASVRREMEGRSEIPNVAKTVDTKGRKQPTTKPKAQADVSSAADRAEKTKPHEHKLTPAQKELVDRTEKIADAKAATEVSRKVADLIEQFEKIDLGPVARMSDDERTELTTQIAGAIALLDKTLIKIAISGGANLGVLSSPNLRYQALAFMRGSIARIETELTSRDVQESAS